MNSKESRNRNSSTDMANESRYLIAQYAANPRRMETKNIGVILWAGGHAETRFVSDDDAADFVNDLSAYRRWISFWHRKVYASDIALPGQSPVSKADPAFMDALLRTQKGNYLLFDAGALVEPIRHADLAEATSFLFDELVATKRAIRAPVEQDNLAAIAERAFQTAGVAERDDFIAQYRIPCKVFGVEQELVFHNAVGVEENLAVFQRVQLRQQAALGAATMFHSMIEEKKVRGKKRCASLVEIPPDDDAKASPVKVIRMLRRVSEVIDLANGKEAAERIRDMAMAA